MRMMRVRIGSCSRQADANPVVLLGVSIQLNREPSNSFFFEENFSRCKLSVDERGELVRVKLDFVGESNQFVGKYNTRGGGKFLAAK